MLAEVTRIYNILGEILKQLKEEFALNIFSFNLKISPEESVLELCAL